MDNALPVEPSRRRGKRLPRLDVFYWLLIVSANTIGEAGGDLISMSLGVGYGASTAVLVAIYFAAVGVDVSTSVRREALYWVVIIVSSTAGTTMSDLVTRSMGLGYGWGSVAIMATLAVIFALWRWVAPRQGIESALGRPAEFLYWLAILVSSTLGTAFGDYISNGTALGFGGGTVVLVACLAVVAALRSIAAVPREVLYWLAIVVTHPLGATMGDYMTKEEGFDLGNLKATAILAAVFVAIVVARAILRPHDGVGTSRGEVREGRVPAG